MITDTTHTYKLVKYKLKDNNQNLLSENKIKWTNWVDEMNKFSINKSRVKNSSNFTEYFWWWDTVHNYNSGYDYGIITPNSVTSNLKERRNSDRLEKEGRDQAYKEVEQDRKQRQEAQKKRTKSRGMEM